jgi:pimeloyl-ACP methyl ester carboxylesterase
MQLASPANGGVRGGSMTGSEVRYVNSGSVHIAYRVFGDGPVDLLLVPAFTSHLVQDVLAVLDAAGAGRPAVSGDLEGAALSALFAATHPNAPGP